MADGDKGKGGGGDGEDTFIQKQREKNELKLKLQAYGDVWEYKTFRWGPFSWKKKVPKQGVEDVLKDERMHMMELDPDADPIPLEDADGNPIEPEEEDVGPSSNQMDQYKALGEHEDHAPKKKMTMVEKFGKMFEAVEVAKTTKDDDDGGAPSPLMTMLSPVKRERKTKKKKRRKKQVDDEFELDQAYRPPTPETKPVSRETKLDKATSKKEGFQWDLRSSWQTYWIYISSTSEDMLAELKLIFEEIVPELQKDGNKKRVRIIPVYLQDG